MKKKRQPGIFCFVIIILCGCLTYLALSPTSQSPPVMKKLIYVWQESWSAAVTQAVIRAAPLADSLMVFSCEIGLKEGRLCADPKRVDWSGLAQSGVPVTLVIRIDAQVAGLLTQEGAVTTANFLRIQIDQLTEMVLNANAMLAGIQLDCDCPSTRLSAYRLLIEQLRPGMAGIEFSITSLADWLNQPDFRQLVQDLSYFVLQVHSLETPKTLHDDIQLCDTEKLPGRLTKASLPGVPFYVALPTYGYRFFYDTKGDYIGFSAEGPEPAHRPGMQVRRLMSDPDKMALAVRELKSHPPKHCLGVAWFRLPVETDRMNWPWLTFQAVIDGRSPVVAIQADLRNPKPDLYEIWLTNSGERTLDEPIQIKVDLGNFRQLAHDGVSGFQWAHDGRELAGPAPQPGESFMAAWVRVMPKDQNQKQLINSIKIEVIR